MVKNITKLFLGFFFMFGLLGQAQITLESEVKITDLAMYFNGVKSQNSTNSSETTPYDFAYGRSLSPHGDCIKAYKQYVFMSWYRGGKSDRHVMLTRYNTETGAMKTIEFPHRHTGLKGKWWIGETHNTIAVGISPINGTVHMVYDMHAYTNGGDFMNDYFRYSYSVDNAAELPDEDFTLDKFIKDPIDGDYRHTTMDGVRNAAKYDRFTYPQFFLNDDGELFLTARDGTSHDGAQAFIKYNTNQNKWGNFYYFNALKAQSKGETHDWSIYGSMKYVDGKIRIGFQRRLRNGNDKFQYQNGVYYAYSDNPIGDSEWKNHKGEAITFPLVKAQEALVFEPGDLVATQAKNEISIVGGFDWTVTDNGDVHIISRVQDKENGVTKNIHSYKPNGANDFTISTDFAKSSNIYTSGNDVFVIGLNAGRPFVDRAVGGTNNFVRVYEQTTGKLFRKGQVYISNGKLYYYLLQNKPGDTDDTQPTYLQIIDLKIEEQPFSVNLISPNDGDTFETDETIEVNAYATTNDGDITKVEFLLDGNVYSEDLTSPYSATLPLLSTGSHTIEAIAHDSNGNTLSSSTNTVQITEVDKTDLTGEDYTLRNVATGEFLTAGASGLGAQPISATMNFTNTDQNKIWTFKQAGDYYNIDSKTTGVLRGPGMNFSQGPFRVVSINKEPVTLDNDKVWTVIYNESDDTYRFESKSSGRYLYLNDNGNVEHIQVPDTDPRSKWQVVTSQLTLSIADIDKDNEVSSIKIYPNPTANNFTVKVLGKNIIDTIEIYNILGRKVYQDSPKNNVLQVNNSGFQSGVYLVKVISKNNKLLHARLVVK